MICAERWLTYEHCVKIYVHVLLILDFFSDLKDIDPLLVQVLSVDNCAHPSLVEGREAVLLLCLRIFSSRSLTWCISHTVRLDDCFVGIFCILEVKIVALVVSSDVLEVTLDS